MVAQEREKNLKIQIHSKRFNWNKNLCLEEARIQNRNSHNFKSKLNT